MRTWRDSCAHQDPQSNLMQTGGDWCERRYSMFKPAASAISPPRLGRGHRTANLVRNAMRRASTRAPRSAFSAVVGGHDGNRTRDGGFAVLNGVSWRVTACRRSPMTRQCFRYFILSSVAWCYEVSARAGYSRATTVHPLEPLSSRCTTSATPSARSG